MGKLDTAAPGVVVNGPEDDVLDWEAVDWRRVEDDVRRLRQRIFTASKAGDLKKVRKAVLTTPEGLARAGCLGKRARPVPRGPPARATRRGYPTCWAADALAELGASVHLAHPLGVKAFSYRRVKNDQRDAADLADLLRMGRLPHAWIAPPETRELRELVRHRAKLVAMRSRCKAEVHAVLAKGGVWVPMTDLFGVEGNLLLDNVTMPAPYMARIASLRRFIEAFDAEIDLFTGLAQRRLTHDAGYTAIQQIAGIGPVLAAVFVAEIGDVHRFDGPAKLTCWAGLTPRHHESDTTVHRGHITKQGSRLVRWAAIESVKILPATSRIGAIRAAAPIWPTPWRSPCARWLTSSTACARPARAPMPCWRTSWPRHRAASTPSWRAGNPPHRGRTAPGQDPRAPLSHRPPPPTRCRAPRPRSCCLSCDAASSAPSQPTPRNLGRLGGLDPHGDWPKEG